ncbi:MAG: methionyl-tRNA formyltransferase [Clostridiales bacterium]|mgnify:CR=1 FL=1|nr:methionyl-tRNA formyltransferase [Clostridiales bacterium]
MKVLFMGTPDFAVSTLDKLIQSHHEIIGVVTQPDKPKGRGNNLSAPPVKELALKHNLTIYQPVKVRDKEFVDKVRQLDPDVIVVAAFGQILPKDLLDIPQYGCINVHASLLPKYRGAAPIQYSIIDGEDKTGITIMYMDEGLDTGDIILQEELEIASDETGGSLFDKMAVLGANLLLKALVQLENGTSKRIPQDDSKATYVKMIKKEMGHIDFAKPAVEIERLIRGLNPWPSAYTHYEGKSLKIWSAEVVSTDIKAEPGDVIEIRKDAFIVMTGEGALAVKELQLEGKKRMATEAFLRGNNLAPGTKLGKE